MAAPPFTVVVDPEPELPDDLIFLSDIMYEPDEW